MRVEETALTTGTFSTCSKASALRCFNLYLNFCSISFCVIYMHTVILQTPTKSSTIDFDILHDMESPIILQEAFVNGKSIGDGLFVSQPEGVDCGTLLTRYPGKPHWYKGNLKGDISAEDDFTLTIGIFRVLNETGQRYVDRVLAWNPGVESELGDTHYENMLAHKVNSSIPTSLDENYRTPNALWGIRIQEMFFDCNSTPNVELWLIASRQISAGNQVLADYHWVFAFREGNWCLDTQCMHCVDGLRSFVRNIT